MSDGLRVVFVGTAVGNVSARKGHYYSDPRNCFYSIIYAAGVVPLLLPPEDDRRLLEFGVGLTDLVKVSHASDDSKLAPYLLKEGLSDFKDKVLQHKPKVVCFNGMATYRAFQGRRAESFGMSTYRIGSSRIFIVPSTSGRVSGTQLFDGKNREQWFRVLAGSLDLQS